MHHSYVSVGLRVAAACISSILVLGCSHPTYETNFQRVSIGQSRADAIANMGHEPTMITQTELPFGMKAERLSWRSSMGLGGTYAVDIVLGRVVSKAREQ